MILKIVQEINDNFRNFCVYKTIIIEETLTNLRVGDLEEFEGEGKVEMK